MHDVTRRTGHAFARLAVFCLFTLILLGSGAFASEHQPEEPAIRASIETYLRTYQETAMLYRACDLRSGTVADPALFLPEGAGETVFLFSGKESTLSQLQEDIVYLEKKAAFYAGMRQMQDIYREDLRLTYAIEELKLEPEGNACRASVTETAEFQYTDSPLPSVYETGYSVRLVKLDGRWLIAGVSNGSLFDKAHKGPDFDVSAALADLAAKLETENCTISFSGTASGGGDQIAYNGEDAAAYAYTYSRRSADQPRTEFYNAQFTGYAGEGGDCMNFASQCMWAGFGGSQDSGAITYHGIPMDNEGANQWFGRPASGGKINHSWISCQSFRQYLTGSKDGTGRGGSNAAGDAGMYATILDAAEGSPLSAVAPQELIGAAAHVEGSGGLYSHAIILTAATGANRSEIYFCGHTRDVTHVKLGDCYFGPIKVYIPRYMRTAGQAAPLRAERLQPVPAGEARILSAQSATVRKQMTITVTAPDGTASQVVSVSDTDNCWGEYLFSQPGLYRVDCRASASDGSRAAVNIYYVRCYAPESPAPGDDYAPPEEETTPPAEESPLPEDEGDFSEMPSWLRQS